MLTGNLVFLDYGRARPCTLIQDILGLLMWRIRWDSHELNFGRPVPLLDGWRCVGVCHAARGDGTLSLHIL